jgi:hypothetical protein
VNLKKFQQDLGIKDSDFEVTLEDMPSSMHLESREKCRRSKRHNRRPFLPQLNLRTKHTPREKGPRSVARRSQVEYNQIWGEYGYSEDED